MNDPQDDQAILDSKYSLVVAVAKRAREIVNRREAALDSGHKPVTVALGEINSGKLIIYMKKEEAVPTGETQEPEPLL